MSKKKKCIGCGAFLQEENVLVEGYTTSIENDICQRCFKIRHYGELETVTKSNKEYVDILKSVGKTKDLVLYVVDLLNIEENLQSIRELVPNKMILVLNKRDVLPKSLKDEKLISYFKDLGVCDTIIISSTKNYNIDLLYDSLIRNKTSRNVYVVGHTNAGKSTLINKMIRNYSESDRELTSSPLPSTTLNTVNIDINDDLCLIDTPGLVDSTSMMNYVDVSKLKKIMPKNELKPKVYQVRKGESIVIDELVRIDYIEGDKNSFIIFASNNLKMKRLYNIFTNNSLKNLNKTSFDVKYESDLVINGLGFIYIPNKCKIDVYMIKEVNIWTRRTIIGG